MLLALVLLLAAEPAWEKKEFACVRPESACRIPSCCQYGFAVYVREKPGMDVKEVKAAGQIDATVDKVWAVVTDYEHQVGNMPYIEKTQVFERKPDYAVFWAQAEFPMVSKRDWVLKSRFEKLPNGGLRAAWAPAEVANAPKPEDGVVRIKVNTGSWTLEPIDGGRRTLATYQVLTDPGGSIPTFIANKANTTALPELFARVRERAEAR